MKVESCDESHVVVIIKMTYDEAITLKQALPQTYDLKPGFSVAGWAKSCFRELHEKLDDALNEY